MSPAEKEPLRSLNHEEQALFVNAVRTLKYTNYAIGDIQLAIDEDEASGDIHASVWQTTESHTNTQRFMLRRTYTVNQRLHTASYKEETIAPIIYQPSLSLFEMILREGRAREAARRLSHHLGQDLFTPEKLFELMPLFEVCVHEETVFPPSDASHN